MRVLVLGATGFIGRQFVARVRNRHELTVTCRDLARCDDGVEGVFCDLARGLDSAALPAQVDAVVHLAQSGRYRDFPDGAADVFAINVASVADSLRYACSAGARQFTLVSSGAVYEPFSGALDEAARIRPVSLYGASKAAAELLTAPYAGSINVTILRPFFPYGPGQSGRFLPGLVQRVRGGEPVVLDGASGGGSVLSLLHVDDMVRVLVESIERQWEGVFNVASPHTLTIQELALHLGRLLDRPVTFQHLPEREPMDMTPALGRLADRVDLSSFVELDEGLRTVVEGEG